MEIFEGNLANPSSIIIPGVQAPIGGSDPLSYGIGESFQVYVQFKPGTKRLLFTISTRSFGSNSVVFQQIVFPQNGQGGIAEFSVGADTTSRLSPGVYYWDVFQLRDDGSKDVWSAYNTGTVNIVEYPSSSTIQLQTTPTTNTIDAYPSQTNTLNMYIVNGSTFSKIITWNSAGEPVNLTGYTAEMLIKNSLSSDSAIFTLSTSNERIALGGEAGTIALNISSEDTSTITVGTYVYTLTLTSGSTVKRLLEGTMSVTN